MQTESLRKKFFKECTQKDSVDGIMIRIDMSPHDLFEWFKREFKGKDEGWITTKMAVDKLKTELKNDLEYRITWQANIAVCFQDAYNNFIKNNFTPAEIEEQNFIGNTNLHTISNIAADNFLNLLCS